MKRNEACVYELRTVPGEGLEDPRPVLHLGGHTAPVLAVDWCAAACTCFTASRDTTVGIHTLFRVTE
jgi:hypothetical protein